ncbi:MAG: DNA-binding domain-containing protein [Candidatus Thiodiazotropha sp. L084R]
MPLLAELQRSFCDALRSSEPPDSALLDALPNDGLALQRFQVYRNNFIVLNGDAVADMFPVIKRLVGDEAFRMLATAYVRKHPPMERILLLYGEAFPDFLQSIPELSSLPYLADVARLEFAWTAAYHAADAEVLQAQHISGLDDSAFESLMLKPHPSIQFLESEYPVYRIWETNQSDDQDEQVSLDEGSCRLVVIRPEMEVEVREVSTGAFIFLKQLHASVTVGEAYEHTVQFDPEFDLQAFFQLHLLDGTFCSL